MNRPDKTQNINDVYENFMTYDEFNFREIPPTLSSENEETYYSILKHNILSEFVCDEYDLDKIKTYTAYIDKNTIVIDNYIGAHSIKHNLVLIDSEKYIVTADIVSHNFISIDTGTDINLQIDLNYDNIDNEENIMVRKKIIVYPNLIPKKRYKIQVIKYVGDLISNYMSILSLENTHGNNIIKSILDPTRLDPGEYTDNNDILNITKCNESQINVINSMKYNIECIHGPAGTGKSTTIINIIFKRIPKHHKILCTAVQNQAIDSLVTKLEEYYYTCPFIVIGDDLSIGDNSKKFTIKEIQKKDTNIQKNKELLKNLKELEILLMERCNSDWPRIFKKFNLTELVGKNQVYVYDFINKKKEECIQNMGVLTKNIIIDCRIILCTIASIHKIKTNIDTVIIDEAGSVSEMTLSNIIKENPKNIILIGDHKQLEAFTSAPREIANNIKFTISYLERAIFNKRPYNMLRIQYRMPYEISNMVSQIFYENLLQSGKLKNDDMESPLKWYDINGKEELYDSSYYNMDEIEIIDKLLRKLGNEYNKNNKNNIIIMSPYNSQIDKINECIKNKYPEKNIKIGTIDSSQGSEYDIVIVSLVRSNDKHNVGFLHDKKRLCVMLSRAKKELWMVGNYSTFSGVRSKKQISIWCDILSHFTLIKNFNKNKIKLLDYL